MGDEHRVLTEALRQQAREHERRAAELRELAAKIDNPPGGIRVELAPDGRTVRFVGAAIHASAV